MKMSDAVDAVEFDSIAESAHVVISNVNLQYRGFYSLCNPTLSEVAHPTVYSFNESVSIRSILSRDLPSSPLVQFSLN